MSYNQSIEEILNSAELAINNTINNAELLETMALYGYDLTEMNIGKSLLETAKDLYNEQKREYSEQYEASEELDSALESIKKLYIRHVKLSRIAFEENPSIWTELGLNGSRKKSFSGFVAQANLFYDNAKTNETVKTELAKLSITEEKLNEAHLLLQNITQLSAKQEKEKSEAQQTPPKREVKERKEDFNEIYDDFIKKKAQEQSSRCSQCGVPFCQVHCPLSNNIPDWLKLTAENRLEEAYELSQSTNNMPEVCGRICPQDRLCEGNCVIEQSGHGTVTIGSIEKYITETAWTNGWVKPIEVKNEINQSVGIIGSGPAGLACGEELRKKGYQITIYDRYDRAGGLLIYGIPNFKLEKHVVNRRIKLLKDGGINFVLNFEVGKDLTLKDLREKHDSILIATGVYKPREVEIPGGDLKNIFPAMQFLTASNRKGLGDKVELFDNGTLDAKDKDVIVIGGGDTAMDCVRTSIRQKAKSVKCIYRRDKENMPGSAREVANAEEEGIEFIWLSNPKKFKGNDKVQSLIVDKIKLGDPDESGRRKPIIEKNSEFEIKADIVIKALGFDPEELPLLFDENRLQTTKWGTIKTNFDTMETNIPGVFAAGDIVRGASLVVWAIKDGRDAAQSIDNYLQQKINKKVA